MSTLWRNWDKKSIRTVSGIFDSERLFINIKSYKSMLTRLALQDPIIGFAQIVQTRSSSNKIIELIKVI